MLAVFCISVLVCLASASHNKIQDKAIYKITSKLDNGALTASNSSSGSDDMKVKVATWTNDAGQKWKSKQPRLAKSFEFKPTSNLKAALDAGGDLNSVFSRIAPKADTKYWYVEDMGEGVFQVKNYISKTCLANDGVGKNAKLMNCDNSLAQQWVFTAL